MIHAGSSAVDARTSSDGASHFDPWALAWIESIVSATAGGSALPSTPCPNFDGQVSIKAEVVVTSPWGIGILKLAGNTFTACMLQPNGTRFGNWVLDTYHNRIAPAADFDSDRRAELILSRPWGIGKVKLSGTTFACPMMQPDKRFGGWLLNTADNQF